MCKEDVDTAQPPSPKETLQLGYGFCVWFVFSCNGHTCNYQLIPMSIPYIFQSPIHISTHMVFCVPAYGSIECRNRGKKRWNPCTYLRKLSQNPAATCSSMLIFTTIACTGWTGEKKAFAVFTISKSVSVCVCLFVILASFSHTCAWASNGKKNKWNFFIFIFCSLGKLCSKPLRNRKWQIQCVHTQYSYFEHVKLRVLCRYVKPFWRKFRWLHIGTVFHFVYLPFRLFNHKISSHILAACVHVLHMEIARKSLLHHYR